MSNPDLCTCDGRRVGVVAVLGARALEGARAWGEEEALLMRELSKDPTHLRLEVLGQA